MPLLYSVEQFILNFAVDNSHSSQVERECLRLLSPETDPETEFQLCMITWGTILRKFFGKEESETGRGWSKTRM